MWAKTVFIVVWDEHGGLFDHVPPPTPPAGTPGEFVTLTAPSGTAGDGLPIGAGFRVGCIIVPPGPRAAGCAVSSSITRPT